MALESLDRINITGLSLDTPEPKPELMFDPKREIPPEMWQEMRSAIEMSSKNYVDADTGHAAAQFIQVLGGDISQEAKQDLRSKLSKKITHFLANRGLHGFWKEGELEEAVAIGANYHLIFGQNPPELGLGITENDIVKEAGALGNTSVLLFMRNLKILYPELAKKPWADLQNRFDVKEYLETALKENNWSRFFEAASYIRCLGADVPIPVINSAVQSRVREVWEIYKRDHLVMDMLERAAELKIVTAEKVVLDETGLHVSSPSVDINQQAPDLPETRNF
jgi:hypothetical protein